MQDARVIAAGGRYFRDQGGVGGEGSMVQEHFPAFSAALKNVRSQRWCLLRSFFADEYRFNDAMYREQHIAPADAAGNAHVDAQISGEHGAPIFTDSRDTLQVLAIGMNAADFFIVCPNVHHRFEVGAHDGLVERVFGFFGAGEILFHAASFSRAFRTRLASSLFRQSR